MRILYFSRDYSPHDYRFLTSLGGSEHQVYFLRLEQRGSPKETRPLPPEVQVVDWAGGKTPADWWRWPAYVLGVRRVIRQIQPDIVHAGPLHTAAFLAALSGGHPLVSMSWAYDLLYEAATNRLRRWAADFALRRSDVLLVDNPAIAHLALVRGFPRERIVIFPWGIDLERFTPGSDGGLRAELGWRDNFVLLHMRNLEPIYGVDVLARAFVQAAGQQSELRLLMLGAGTLEAEVRGILEQGGVLDKVHFTGTIGQDRLPAYYRAADLYISASHSDGSSVSLMEAMASGLPSLVSNIPGNRQWIDRGVQGWLFPDGDPDGLAQGILEAYAQHKQLPQMGEAARKVAEERANWGQNFKKLLAGYEFANRLRGNNGNSN